MSDLAASRTHTDWPVIAVLFTAGLVAAMQFGKVAPIMGEVQQAFGLDLVGAGFAVSILGLIGLVFGVAAGAVVASIGFKRALIIALFGGAAMAAIGAIAPNGIVFLATRLAEGFSHLLVVVAAPALMTAHSTRKDTPFVLAIWGCFFGCIEVRIIDWARSEGFRCVFVPSFHGSARCLNTSCPFILIDLFIVSRAWNLSM